MAPTRAWQCTGISALWLARYSVRVSFQASTTSARTGVEAAKVRATLDTIAPKQDALKDFMIKQRLPAGAVAESFAAISDELSPTKHRASRPGCGPSDSPGENAREGLRRWCYS